MLVLADPYSFATEALLDRLGELRPSMPVLGGLASASAVGSASLFRNGEVLNGGAVACSLSGVSILPCVSQGAAPVGPEMTITAAHDNVIEELGISRPAIERLREALGGLDAREQQLAASGLMLGIVIDENKPDYERGDFLVRPIIAADSEAGTIALGERIRVGQTVRMHIRDGASADQDLRAALGAQAQALGSGRGGRRPAVHLQRARLAHVRGPRPRRDGAGGRPRRPGRRVLLRGRDRPGRRPQLPPRLHGDDGRVRGRIRPLARMADREELRELVTRVLAEDLGDGDITSQAVVPPDASATARIVQKQPGVVFGLEVAAEAFAQAGAGSFERLQPEGEWRDSCPR